MAMWTDPDEIWHGGGPQGGKVLGFFYPPPPPGTGCIKGGGSKVPLKPQPSVLAKTLKNKSCRAPLI